MNTKKLFMLLAAVLLSSVSAFAQSGNNEPLKGDVNEDGTVDVADITAVIKIMRDDGGTAEQPKNYWYVGTTPITSSSIPGSGTVYGMNESTEIGWHTLEGSPSQIQVGPKRLDTKSTWYVAVPAYLGFTKAYGGALVDELMVPQNMTLADGQEYTVFTAMAQSKSIDYIIK